jgi:plasmid stabilization system protein ParE
MTDKKRLSIEYSKQSLNNAKEIVAYLKLKFSDREVNKFYQALEDFERIISLYPTLYSESQKIKVRRAVLSRVLSVYYSINEDKISIIAIFDNRWDESKKLK